MIDYSTLNENVVTSCLLIAEMSTYGVVKEVTMLDMI